MRKNKNTQSIFSKMLITLVFGTLALAATVQPAQAGFPTITLGDIPAAIRWTWEKISAAAGSRAFHQAVRSVTFRLARDSAVWLASGDSGKKPLVFQQGLGDALGEIGDEVGGKFLANISANTPIDVCSPSSIDSKLKLVVGVSGSIGDIDIFPDNNVSRDTGKTGCKLTEIGNNFQQAYENRRDSLKELSKGFSIDNNELGSFLIFREYLTKEKKKKEEQEKSERQGEGLKPVKDPITGQIKTPVPIVEATITESTKKAVAPDTQPTGDLLTDVAQIFANTFVQTYLRKLQAGLLRPSPKRAPGSSIAELSSSGSRGKLAIQSGENIIGIEGGEFDTGQFSLCPSQNDSGLYQSPYQCLMTSELSSAISRRLTIRQAVDESIISPDTQFPQKHISSRPNLSLENLKRLRFLRIIPIGWEIAAERLKDANKTVTFSKLLDCFKNEVDSSCPSDPNDPSGKNILYRLVDPSWVLAMPEYKCNAIAYSSLPVYNTSPDRQDVCVDLSSCVNKDANGKCQDYGYCARERVVWDLEAPKCEPQYATCLSFTSPRPVSLVTAYVDSKGCDSNSAGCKWYSTGEESLTAQRVYLNNKAQSCFSKEETREVIVLGIGVNVVKNGDFDSEFLMDQNNEIISDSDGGWQFSDIRTEYLEAGAVRPSGGENDDGVWQKVSIKPYTYYTLSFTVSGFSGSNPAVVDVSGDSIALRNVSFPNDSYNDADYSDLRLSILQEIGPGRYAATFYSGTQADPAVKIHLKNQAEYRNIQLEEISLNSGALAIDTVASAASKTIENLNAVPFEQGSANAASPTTQFKKYSQNQRAVFSGAETCQADEATARKYERVDNGDIKIARLTAGNLCPAQCDGFDSFLEMPTSIEQLASSSALRPEKVNFVPSLGAQCVENQVGCEVFTNMKTDSREYYSRIESCVLDTNPYISTFYTWEAGQLKAWQLLKDKSDSYENLPGVQQGPCTEYNQGEKKEPSESMCDADASPECNADDPGALCRTFLDEDGNEYYLDANKIVTASGACTEFRRTEGQDLWYFVPSEANKCSASAVGCREYKGKKANSFKELFTESFENEFIGVIESGNVPSLWWVVDNNSTLDISVSSDNAIFGTHSLLIRSSVEMGIAMDEAISNYDQYDFRGKSYELRFIAKSLGGNPAITGSFLRTTATGEEYFFQGIPRGGSKNLFISSEWREYILGPLYYRETNQARPDSQKKIAIELTGAEAGVLIDNLRLREIDDRYYLINASTSSKSQGGNQPDVCFAEPQINSCNAYADDRNNKYYVSSFEKLFPTDQSLTCRAVIDTQNYDYPYSRTFDMGTDEQAANHTYAVDADEMNYRYISAEKSAGKNQAGCAELKLPNISANGSIVDYTTVYKRLDPDLFLGDNGILCSDEGLWCEEFTSESSGTFRFRDPGNKLCSWDENAVQGGQGGFVYIDENSNKQLCDISDGFVPQCPTEANTCTAYAPVDPNLTEGAQTALFALADSMAAASCTSQDIERNCVQFDIATSTSSVLSAQYDPSKILKSNLTPAKQGFLEVAQSRQCAEWLAPTTFSQANDRNVTYGLGRCQKMSGNTCVLWAVPDGSAGDYPEAYTDGTNAREFNIEAYQNRYDGGKTIYSGAWDYSGYSIPDQYPVEVLQEAGPDNAMNLGVSTGSGFIDVSDIECRGYPEEDSPFSGEGVIIPNKDGHIDYSGVINYSNNNKLEKLNICWDGSDDCDCSYKKISALDKDVFLPKNSTKNLPEDTSAITVHDGWYGYCLETAQGIKDPLDRDACMAWWPVDVVKAKPNVFENFPSAGFSPGEPVYYCLEAKGNKIAYDFNLEFKNSNYIIDIGSDWLDYFLPTTNSLDHKYWIILREVAGDIREFTKSSGIIHNLVNKTKADNPFVDLYEYDIESIILTPKNAPESWPNGGDIVLGRESGDERMTTYGKLVSGRWSAFWCGGEENRCDDLFDEYSWNVFKKFIHANASFLGTCEESNSNIFAVQAVFADMNGNAPIDSEFAEIDDARPNEFLGFEGGLCDGRGGTAKIEFDMKLQLREWCSTVAQVYDNEGRNAAWTGRVSSLSDYNLDGLYSTPFRINQDNRPFGAMVPPTDSLYTPEQWDSRPDKIIDEFTGDQKDGEIGKQPLYVEAPDNQVRAGSPYACGTATTTCVFPPIKDGSTVTQYVDADPDNLLDSLINHPFNYLKKIFAKIYNIWHWDSSSDANGVKGYSDSGFADADIDRFDNTEEGQCPVIMATTLSNGRHTKSQGQFQFNELTLGDCGKESQRLRPVYFGRYSINGVGVANTDGVVASTIDVNVGQEVKLQFYGFNENGEQLPIKKIIIDWTGQNTTEFAVKENADPANITVISGNFKNHHFDCNPNSNSSSGFGFSNDSCVPEPFVFTHVYQEPDDVSPVVIIIDNWGRKTRARYDTDNHPSVLRVNHMDMSILPPNNLSIIIPELAEGDYPDRFDDIRLEWESSQQNPGVVATGYKISIKRNYSNKPSETELKDVSVGTFSDDVTYDSFLKSFEFKISTKTNKAYGSPAVKTVYFKPAMPSITEALRPVIGQPLVMQWSAVNFADFYQINLIKQDQDGDAIGTETRTVSQTQNTYNYEPDVKRIEVKIKACNGPACGIDWTSGMINYIDAVVIDAESVATISQSYRENLSHYITASNKTSGKTFSIPDNPYSSWLSINSATGEITDGGALTSADVGTKTFNVKVTHSGTNTTDTKQMQITVIDTCNNSITDGGEVCDPTDPLFDGTSRCTDICEWSGDLDGDGVAGATDCLNNERNAYPGSTHRGRESKDYNCDGTISNESVCSVSEQSDYACAASPNSGGPDCYGGRIENPTSVTACPGGSASNFCQVWKGTGARVNFGCNNYNEVGCTWCPAGQTTVYW